MDAACRAAIAVVGVSRQGNLMDPFLFKMVLNVDLFSPRLVANRGKSACPALILNEEMSS